MEEASDTNSFEINVDLTPIITYNFYVPNSRKEEELGGQEEEWG